MIGRAGPGEKGLAAVALVAIVGLVAMPLTRLGWVELQAGGASIGRVVRSPGFAAAARHSLVLAALVPLLAVPLGAAIALLLRRPDVPCRAVLRVLVLLPLLIPQFVLGYSWTQAYGRAGFTDDLIGLHWDGLTGPAGITAVLVVDAVPICYLLTSVGLAVRSHAAGEHAARVSGAGGLAALRTVTVPLLRPALAAAFVLVFVSTLESFAAPQVLGAPAGYATLTTRLYADLALGSDPDTFVDAVTLGIGLVLLALLLLLPADLLVAPRLRSGRTAASSSRTPAPGRTLWARGMAGVLAVYSVLAVLVPTAALVLAALTRAVGLAPTPGNWTLGNFHAALDAPTRAALGHSVQLAAESAVLLTALGAIVAVLQRHRSGRLLGTLTTLTFAVPGSALAVGLLIAYDGVLGGTLALILLAYLAKFWALAHRTIAGAIDRVPPGEWWAARASGAGPAAAIGTVWLPALAPALVGAGVLVFVSALHEVTMSSLLYSTGSETFAVAVLNRQELGDTGTTAALSVLLTLVLFAVAVPGWMAVRLGSRHRSQAILPLADGREVAHAG